MKILLLSDIHLISTGAPEQQGQILQAFFTDIQNQLTRKNYNDNFCIISGDLVNDGKKSSYTYFYKEIITKLLTLMPLENIFVVAGNHDLYRDSIDIDKTKDILEKDNDEKDFNNLLNDKKANILTSKFKNFNTFVNDNLNIGQFDIWGYSANLWFIRHFA